MTAVEAAEKIHSSAWAVVRGELRGPSQSGLCLALTRVVVEHALGMPSHAWYRWRTDIVPRPNPEMPWARDMERSLRPMSVKLKRTGPSGDPQRYVDLRKAVILPGSLLFRWDAAPSREGDFIGHVAIALDHGLLLENINPTRRETPFGMGRDANRLTPIGEWPITSVVLFDPDTL